MGGFNELGDPFMLFSPDVIVTHANPILDIGVCGLIPKDLFKKELGFLIILFFLEEIDGIIKIVLCCLGHEGSSNHTQYDG